MRIIVCLRVVVSVDSSSDGGAVLEKLHRPIDVVIRNVTRFAYAEMGDETYALWALGEAGWFNMERPAAPYQGTYDADVQAVQLLYFLIDCYSETPRKKGGGPSASLLYREVSGRGQRLLDQGTDCHDADHMQYAEREKFACADAAEAEEIFHKHREFLLMSFLQRTYGISWSNTPIYQTLRRHFPVSSSKQRPRWN